MWIVPKRNERSAGGRRYLINHGQKVVAVGWISTVQESDMGAAGFEPATAWSEAKYSVQTELSALTTEFPAVPYKSLDLGRFR